MKRHWVVVKSGETGAITESWVEEVWAAGGRMVSRCTVISSCLPGDGVSRGVGSLRHMLKYPRQSSSEMTYGGWGVRNPQSINTCRSREKPIIDSIVMNG